MRHCSYIKELILLSAADALPILFNQIAWLMVDIILLTLIV